MHTWMRNVISMAVLSCFSLGAMAAEHQNRDQFFWLGAMNKATAVINSDEGLLDPAIQQKVAKGIQAVIDQGNQPGGKRPAKVIEFEPLMIQEAGMDVTMLHIGRSSQDMHSTFDAAIMRDNLLRVSEKLARVMQTMNDLATQNQNTIVPNYTNGVAAQPNSYAHYLMGFMASFERHQVRLQEFYDRLNLCAMGTTVLNGTSWPLNRDRMAQYLGFDAPVPNAYDASQIKGVDDPLEFASIITAIAIRTGMFVEDVMVQYAQPRPWILLQEGGANTYVSSAMPQKRNPGLLINTRVAASNTVASAQNVLWLAHNVVPGMVDAKSAPVQKKMVGDVLEMLNRLNQVLKALNINPERALEELNNDWTASQEIADVFMREYQLPFRVGHHVASQMVSYAKANNIKPTEFPYDEMKRIYAEVITKEYPQGNKDCPMSEELFRQTLNPVAIVQNRRTAGGPQPEELKKAITHMNEHIAQQKQWIHDRRTQIATALEKLDQDFAQLLK